MTTKFSLYQFLQKILKRLKLIFQKLLNNKASTTVETSLVFSIFIFGYLILVNVATSLMSQSLTYKALFETTNEIAHIIQMTDEFFDTNSLKTKNFTLDDYKKVVNRHIESDEFDQKSFLNELIQLGISHGKGKIKNTVYSSYIENLFRKNLSMISPKLSILSLKIDDLDFSKSRILENGSEITIALNYKKKYDYFGFSLPENNITQYITQSLWINHLVKGSKKSIWDETNFIRGRYFASKLKSENLALKDGYGFDYIDSDKNLVQVISLNIFNSTYSNDQGQLKDGFFEQLKYYTQKLKQNYETSKTKLQTKDLSLVEVSNYNPIIVLVLPNEAKDKTNLLEKIEDINSIGPINIIYKENAFND